MCMLTATPPVLTATHPALTATHPALTSTHPELTATHPADADAASDVKGRDDVLKMGIGVYNEECRSIVMR